MAEVSALTPQEQAAAVAKVQDGYSCIAKRYLAERGKNSPDLAVLEELTSRLPAGSRVLDAGCGSGVPVARDLSRQYQVVGADISIEQLHLARAAVPSALLVHQDLTQPGVGPGRHIARVRASVHLGAEDPCGRYFRKPGLMPANY